jgi:tetratricopeptide (TPR) repeat protein
VADHEDFSPERLRALLATAEEGLPSRLPLPEVARLCRELASRPPSAQVLLTRNSSRYGHLDVGKGLLDWAYALRHKDPRRMLELARAAVRFARALPKTVGPSCLLADLRAEAWMVFANALRVNNRLRAAEAAFRRARSCLEAGSGDGLLQAKLNALLGALRVGQQRFPEALDLFREAARLYERLGDGHLAGEVLVAIGRAHQQAGDLRQALRCLHAALSRIESGRDRTLPLVTLQIIAELLNDAGYPEDAVAALREAAPLYDLAPGDVMLLRFQWSEGKLCAKLGREEEALRRLEAVRRAFLDLQLPLDAALAALDLAALHARRGQMDRVAALAAEMLPVFRTQEIHREARLALLLFARAAQAGRATPSAIARWARRAEAHRRP